MKGGLNIGIYHEVTLPFNAGLDFLLPRSGEEHRKAPQAVALQSRISINAKLGLHHRLSPYVGSAAELSLAGGDRYLRVTTPSGS